jgi:hypothetical protein
MWIIRVLLTRVLGADGEFNAKLFPKLGCSFSGSDR